MLIWQSKIKYQRINIDLLNWVVKDEKKTVSIKMSVFQQNVTYLKSGLTGRPRFYSRILNLKNKNKMWIYYTGLALGGC